MSLHVPLVPRDGQILQVIAVCRVSSPGDGKQDPRSLDDQEAMLRRWIKDYYDQKVEISVVAGSGSGECLERREYLDVIGLIESNKYDLVLCEDLGRIVRRIHAHLICELCIDHGVRLIAVNDRVDTAEDGWQDSSFISTWHHERSNRDTSNRIKRTHRHRFLSGGCAAIAIYGYRKKPGAKSDNDWERVPEAEPILKQWFEKLEQGATYSEVADWLNEQGVPLGKHCRAKRWNGRIVARVTHNPLLKGIRYRNKRQSRRTGSGKYITEKAPSSLFLEREVPWLAFFNAAYYDRVVAKVDARNAKYKRAPDGATDPCRDRPKKRTRYPGQSVYCGVCGRMYVFGGHGQTDRLMCDGARDHKCWNGATFDGPLAAERISAAIFTELENLKDFDPLLLSSLEEEIQAYNCQQDARSVSIQQAISQCDREIAGLVKYVAAGDESASVRDALRRVEQRKQQLVYDLHQIVAVPHRELVVPTVAEIKQIAETAFSGLAQESQEFANLLRRLVGPIYVLPYRLCDGGHIGLRAKLQIRLSGFLEDVAVRQVLSPSLEGKIQLDLFNMPQRAALRERIVLLRKEHTELEVARELGITVTAAQKAAALDRLMTELGISDPYIRLFEPPSGDTKFRRHLHPRYRFEPLPGHNPE